MCPAAQRFAALVARKLAASGGAALFVDYGKDGPPASSLRGIVDHAFVDPLLRCAGGSLLRWVGRGSCSGMLETGPACRPLVPSRNAY